MALLEKQTSSADVNGHYKHTKPTEPQQVEVAQGNAVVQPQQPDAAQPIQPQEQAQQQDNNVQQGETTVRTPFSNGGSGGNAGADAQSTSQPAAAQNTETQYAPIAAAQRQPAAAQNTETPRAPIAAAQQQPVQDGGIKRVPNGRYLRKDGKKGLSLFAVDDSAPDVSTTQDNAVKVNAVASAAPETVLDKPIRTPDAQDDKGAVAASEPQPRQAEPSSNSVAQLEASQKELNAKLDARDKTDSQRRNEIGDALKKYSDAFNDPNTSGEDKKKIAKEATKLFGEFEATDDKNITDRRAVAQTETLKGANGEPLGEIRPNADGTATVEGSDGRNSVTVGKDGTPLVKFKDQLYEFKDMLDTPEFSVYHHAGDLARAQQAAESADTPEGRKRERRKKAVAALAAVADVLGALGNMFFTTKGARSVKNTNFSGVVASRKAAEDAKLAERAKYWEERIKAADKSDAEMTKLVNSTNMKAYLTKLDRAFKERFAAMRYNNMQKQTEAKRDAAIRLQEKKIEAAREAAETKYQNQRALNRQRHEYSSAQIAQRGKEARSTADRRASNTLEGRKKYADYRHQKGYDKGISLFGK